MLQPPPAEPGMSIEEVDTPALLIDLDALESNLDHMAAFARAHARKHRLRHENEAEKVGVE